MSGTNAAGGIMRASTLFVVLLLAGCGKPAAVPGDAPKSAGKKAADLPKPDGKIDAADLMHHYTQMGFDHQWDGKTVEVRMSSDIWLAPDSNGKPCFLYGTDKGYKRPALIARTQQTWKKGASPIDLPTVKLQGRLIGLVAYKDRPEFRDWSNLVPGRYTPAFDKVALLEDAVVIDD